MVKRRPGLAKGVSVNRAVMEEVDSDFSVQDSLARDYANLSSLARLLVPQVARRLKVRAKDVNAVGVACAL